MIIHIGESISLHEEDILVILDKKTVEYSKKKSIFINKLIANGEVANHIDENIKSYIITSESSKRKKSSSKKIYKLYVSNISSTSLLKRHKDIDRRRLYVE